MALRRGLARVYPYLVAADIKSEKLVPVLESFEMEPQPMRLVTPNSRITPKVRAFLDHATAALKRLDVINESGSPKQRPVERSTSSRVRR
ncbi:MAG TPA: hypothetical protein VF934_09405 [Burkholderiales bacterium]